MAGSNTLGLRIMRLYLPLAFFSVLLLFPFLWMVIVSFKPDRELLDISRNPFLIRSLTFDHYVYLFEETEFLRWTMNTFIVTVGATAVALSCSILIGYAL